jgi:hypothetical protein
MILNFANAEEESEKEEKINKEKKIKKNFFEK